MLLRAATSGSDRQVEAIYHKMVELVYRAPAATRERFLRQLPQPGDTSAALEITACFHVAVDVPGFGRSLGTPKELTSKPAEVLSDLIRSLGKSHAYAIVGAEQSGGAVIKAIVQKPSIASFAALRDPNFEPGSMLTQVLQPVAVLSASSGKNAALARRISLELQQGKLVELPSKGKARDAAAAAALASFLRESNQQGSDPGVVGKKMPLLSRLAGGIKAWGRVDKASGNAPQQREEATHERPSGGGATVDVGKPQAAVDMDAVAKKLESTVVRTTS